MNAALLEQIDQEIEQCRKELAQDTIKLVNIKSVLGQPEPGAPFGPGPRAVLDEVLKMGKEAGLSAIEYTDSVIALGLQAGEPDLGIWIHGDVVPEGPGWDFEPYNAVEHNGYLIGRGVTDNKGQFCAMFHLMKIFKKLGIRLNYVPAIYVGSNEEKGANDVKDFLTKHQPPKMSLVPDSGFPVGYGGRGSMYLRLRPKTPLQNLTIIAGQDDDPGKAMATIGDRVVEARSFPRHLSKPDPNGNMITRLMEKLLDDPEVAPQDRPVLEFFKRMSLDINGASFGMKVPSVMNTVMAIGPERIDIIDGSPELVLKIRTILEFPTEVVARKIAEEAERYGVEVSYVNEIVKPYLRDLNWSVLKRLEAIANEVTGDKDSKPYVVGGYTYAHLLPNALVYGTDANVIPPDFPEGHGGAHGVDESASLDRLQRAMRIYARALLVLNEMDWEIE